MISFFSKFTNYLSPLPAYSGEFSDSEQVESPRKEGELAPSHTFNDTQVLWQSSFSKPVKSDMTPGELCQKPLVLVFYSVYWNGYGISLLKKLQAISNEVHRAGANILVVSSEDIKNTWKATGAHQLSLNFYSDTEKVLARKFGVFSEEKPTWNLYSGVDHNIPLLSVYVTGTEGQIRFSHIEDFSAPLCENDLLMAVAGQILKKAV